MDESDKATASQKLAHFSDKKDIVKALDTTNAELLYIGTSFFYFIFIFFGRLHDNGIAWNGKLPCIFNSTSY